MDQKRVIDAQFDRAVEMVQGLPKTGPIQTSYDAKLTMYSLYKQATVGNVTTPRPPRWDMLNRAKWDEWAKRKDVDPYDAKSLYVDALLKVLRKYSDKTMANKLVAELESYGVDPASGTLRRSLPKSANSSSSGSTASDEPAPAPAPAPPQRSSTHIPQPAPDTHVQTDDTDTTTEDETDDEPRPSSTTRLPIQAPRPQSSLSSHRYRTPMAGSLAMTPPAPVHAHVPAFQPLPGFETPSAFAEPSPHSIPSSLFPSTTTAGTYTEQFSGDHVPLLQRPANMSPGGNIYQGRHRGQSQPLGTYAISGPSPQPTLERAIESVQGHLAALTERLEVLELNADHLHRSGITLGSGSGGSPKWSGAQRGSPTGRRDLSEWDLDDLGMWSLVLNPLSRTMAVLRDLARFFARNESRSPTLIIVRRLCLDVSFLLCVLAVVRAIWRKSGVRRREVRAALIVLWRAFLGTEKRSMVDRGV